MGARGWLYAGLILLSCFLVGAALGVWLYTLAGNHIFAVPFAAVVVSVLVGVLGVWLSAYLLGALARRARAPAGPSTASTRTPTGAATR